MDGKIGLKFWHSGVFKTLGNGKLVYEGGCGITKHVDPNLLSYFDLVELGKESCGGKEVVSVYYLMHGLNLKNGLRKVVNDADVLEVTALAGKIRCVKKYLFHGVVSPDLQPIDPPPHETHFQQITQATQCPLKPSKHKKAHQKEAHCRHLILSQLVPGADDYSYTSTDLFCGKL
ncbi:FO synthase subunit 1 [Bienertia sinuspersici]